MRRTLDARLLLTGVLFATLTGLGVALVTQHVYDMRPCAWCAFQRLLYLGIAMLAAVGLVLPASKRTLAAGAAGLVAFGGLGVALYQHLVAAQAGSCGFSWAARFLYEWRLDELVPWLFQASASCSEANVPLLGVSYALWSAQLFVLLGLGSWLAAFSSAQAARR